MKKKPTDPTTDTPATDAKPPRRARGHRRAHADAQAPAAHPHDADVDSGAVDPDPLAEDYPGQRIEGPEDVPVAVANDATPAAAPAARPRRPRRPRPAADAPARRAPAPAPADDDTELVRCARGIARLEAALATQRAHILTLIGAQTATVTVATRRPRGARPRRTRTQHPAKP